MIYLRTTTEVNGCETEEVTAIKAEWLKKYLASEYGDDPDYSTIEAFLANYTSDEANEVIGMAILNRAVAFTYNGERENPFEMYGSSNWHAMAIVDFVSQTLQDVGQTEASKTLACTFNL